MTRFNQISAAALLALFASTSFTATAQARVAQERCEQTSFNIFRTACEKRKLRRTQKIRRYVPPTPTRGRPVLYNFRGRTDAELGARSLNGGGESSGGGRGGRGGRGGKP